MTNVIYTAISRQNGLTKELTTIANNIANADTIGFRSDRPFYSEYVRVLSSGDQSLSQTRIAGRVLDFSNGAFTKTGAQLDVAIEGEGFFVIDTPQGERLSRAGSFSLNAQGGLTTQSGHSVLDQSGAPITIPTDAANLIIADDGAIAADGLPVGQLAVATAPATALIREGDNLLRSTAAITPVTAPKLRQGFVEESNVNSVMEITRLIEVQRAFELNQQIIADEHERVSRAIDAFGNDG